VAAVRERKEIGFPFRPRQRKDKAQGSVHGRRLHVLHVVAGREVTEPPRCYRTCVGARWPGHAAMGRRGPLTSKPYHFSKFF
jgi:hypothetical protein